MKNLSNLVILVRSLERMKIFSNAKEMKYKCYFFGPVGGLRKLTILKKLPPGTRKFATVNDFDPIWFKEYKSGCWIKIKKYESQIDFGTGVK